jgi:cellobiose phosphorylase
MMEHIHKKEWLKQGFFNGYYDNQKKRVEGRNNNITKMILISQVFPIMSGVAQDWQIKRILESIQKHLFDKKLKGYRLNTDFSRQSFKTSGGIPPFPDKVGIPFYREAGKEEQHNLGRAFSFVYGDKENGSFFNHMIVLFAYALYKRGYVNKGWDILKSICNMAMNTERSKIYPCLPEYFNLEGRGMYPYLTGSASWLVLTMINEVFGIKGKEGNLVIEPKLCAEQFKGASTITINRVFAERHLQVNFLCPKKLRPDRYKIIKVSLDSCDLPFKESRCIIIKRKSILNLPAQRMNILNIVLG